MRYHPAVGEEDVPDIPPNLRRRIADTVDLARPFNLTTRSTSSNGRGPFTKVILNIAFTPPGTMHVKAGV